MPPKKYKGKKQKIFSLKEMNKKKDRDGGQKLKNTDDR